MNNTYKHDWWQIGLLILGAIFFLGSIQGCAALRYDLGFRAGTKAYKYAKKHDGTLPTGYGSGYIGAIRFWKVSDDLEDTLKDAKKIIKELEIK